MTYGVPYRGSKNRIAKDIIDILPSGNRLVDLFAGGCAITHCAILSGKWKKILNNDICPLRGQTLFINASEGEYLKDDYYHIVSKQEFYEKRDKEPHMMAVWGWNGQKTYLGQNWYDDVVVKRGITDLRHLPKGALYPTHNRLLRLQRLSGLDLSKVEFSQMNYANYEHQEGDVVYCDPPYANTSNIYGVKFDTDAFWEWARTRDYHVYVSEYKAPDDFVSIWSKKRGGVQDGRGYANNTTHIEHLFIHSKWRIER